MFPQGQLSDANSADVIFVLIQILFNKRFLSVNYIMINIEYFTNRNDPKWMGYIYDIEQMSFLKK